MDTATYSEGLRATGHPVMVDEGRMTYFYTMYPARDWELR